MYTFPGYSPGTQTEAPAPSLARRRQAQRDGGEMISADGETIYRFRFGDYWRAHWTGNGFGAWEKSPEYPEGVTRL